MRGGGGSLLGQVVGCGALGSGRAADQEVSNPLSRHQPAGLLRPHPRQKRVSWGTARRLARSALPRIGMSPSGRSLPSVPTRPLVAVQQRNHRGSDLIRLVHVQIAVCRCVYKKALCPRSLSGQRTSITSACPQADLPARDQQTLAKLAKIMTDWWPLNQPPG